jgi:hypothetical protein
VRRNLALVLGVTLMATSSAHAGTFAPTPIAPEYGLDGLTRGVARQLVGRDVFANPYATVTISNVDVYDRFPYVEARNFQVVSDPQWNRLVAGEVGKGLVGFDGKGTPTGALSGPRGMAVDEFNRLYVADTGNDRIVVMQVSTEFEQVTLVPLYSIPGLHGPYDVAYSDGGTPFVTGDDALLVADTGRNRVAAFALRDGGASEVASVGGLGSGDDAFAGPMAVAIGRADGASTRDAYVADAHNGRIVRLRMESGALNWAGSVPAGATVVTSLDTDHWGNVYAAAPQQGLVRKFSPALEAVAELHGAIARPRSFRVPFSTIRDHRDGTAHRQGQPTALSLDQWSDQSGMVLWNLGLSVDALGVVGGDAPVAHFTLTDPASVSLEVRNAADGRVLSHRSTGVLPAGVQDLPLTAADLAGSAGTADLVLRVSAVSRYDHGPTASAQASFRASGGTVQAPNTAMLMGSWPNPVREGAHIAFALPQGAAARASLGVFDAAGRRVRSVPGPFVSGMNSVMWDGNDDSGHPVRSGLYFYRLDADNVHLSHRMVVVR